MQFAGRLAALLLSVSLAGCGGVDFDSFTGGGSGMKMGVSAPITADRLVGSWGLASYHDSKDAESIEKAARNACGQPYVIGRGSRPDTVRMHAPFARAQSEMAVRESLGTTYIGPPGAGNASIDRQVLRWDGNVLVTRYVDQRASSVYGNMVFVRCGSRG